MTTTTPTTMSRTTANKLQRVNPYAYRVPIFAVPQKILCNNLLKKLSGDSIALFLLLASKLHRKKTKECQISDFEVSVTLDIPLENVTLPRAELRDCNLIEYMRTSQGALYKFNDDELPAPATPPATKNTLS
jgi:hypothetical protein